MSIILNTTIGKGYTVYAIDRELSIIEPVSTHYKLKMAKKTVSQLASYGIESGIVAGRACKVVHIEAEK